MNVLSFDDVVLLHDSAASHAGVNPSRSLYLGAFGGVRLVDPIVDVMIVHVFARQPVFDHLHHWVEQLARTITVQVRLRLNLALPALIELER